MIGIFKYWFSFIKEFRILYKYRKAAISLRPELEATGLRVDNLGRIYTVINLKEELLNQPELMQQSYVLGQLGPITSILMKYGMADTSFPEISKIEGSSSYLVVCWPERDYVEFSAFFINFSVTSIVAAIIWAAVKYVPFKWLLETIQSYN
jgi:hypothetical protein